MGNLLGNIRYASRKLRGRPVQTAVAVIALGLGIGAATSVFSFVNAFLLRPLPFDAPERLVHVWGTDSRQGWRQERVSMADFLDWREQSSSFADLATFNYTTETITGIEVPRPISAARVSANALKLLGVAALRGRTFEDVDDGDEATRCVVVSERFWRDAQGADPGVLGSVLELNEERYAIVGVMPEGFRFPLPTTDVWIVRSLLRGSQDRDSRYLQVVGRLSDGVTMQQAQAELDRIAVGLSERYPQTNADKGVSLVPLREALNFASDLMPILSLVLMSGAAFVLLIACANVAGLLLASMATRSREISIRLAIGAGRGRLTRQLLTESALLALLGGACGVAFGELGTRAVGAVIPADLYRVGETSVDSESLLVALGLAAATTLLFGMLPALRASRTDILQTMAQGSAGAGSSRGQHRLQGVVIVVEILLAFVLVAATGAMSTALARLGSVDAGFDPNDTLALTMHLKGDRYRSDESVQRFQQRLVEETEHLPGVVRAATIDFLPLNHEYNISEFSIPGRDAARRDPLQSIVLRAGSGYFETMGIAMQEGRAFNLSDGPDAPSTAVIGAEMARRHWPDSSPIGARIRLQTMSHPLTIVGVAAEVRQTTLGEERLSEIYLPAMQSTHRYMRLLVRHGQVSAGLVTQIRELVRTIDSTLPLMEIRTLKQVVDDFLLPQRSVAQWLGAFSAGSLWMACIGVFGLVSFFVRQRLQEFGIRIAVGATTPRIVSLALGGLLPLCIIGIAAGAGASVVLLRLAAAAMPEMQAGGAVFVWSALLILIVALLSGLSPALRASRVDPMRILMRV